MGIHSGSLSLCRYRLVGERRFGPERLSTLNGMLEHYKAAPLKLTGVKKEEASGWVRPLGAMTDMGADDDPDASWDMTHCQVDDGFLLRFRIEKRRVPGTLLQLLYKQKYYAARNAGGKPPGPKARRDMKDELKLDLTGKALPQVAHVDAFWRERQGEVLLFATGKKLRETFEKLFAATFATPLELSLVRVEAPLMGLTATEWQDTAVAMPTLGRLSSTTPVAFAETVYP